MKRSIKFALVLLMLSMMVFPINVFATEPTNTSFDYLDSDEQAYVTSVRSLITLIKGRVSTAKTNLQTFFLQDDRSWRTSMIGDLSLVNEGIAQIGSLSAPPNFSDFNQQCKLDGIEGEALVSIQDSKVLQGDLVGFARSIANIDSELTRVERSMNTLLSNLEKRIDAIAKVEKMGEEAISKWLDSCSYRPSPPYR